MQSYFCPMLAINSSDGVRYESTEEKERGREKASGQEFTLWPFCFPLGNKQEMSLAREEVIEIVRDYKTSKHGRKYGPLEQSSVRSCGNCCENM